MKWAWDYGEEAGRGLFFLGCVFDCESYVAVGRSWKD